MTMEQQLATMGQMLTELTARADAQVAYIAKLEAALRTSPARVFEETRELCAKALEDQAASLRRIASTTRDETYAEELTHRADELVVGAAGVRALPPTGTGKE